jgi:hypothetical protein
MNMEVKPEELCKTVKEIREMLRDHVLPRLTELEIQLHRLRRETWPVTQAVSEKSSYIDAELYKKNYLGSLFPDESEDLLSRKQKILGYRYD